MSFTLYCADNSQCIAMGNQNASSFTLLAFEVNIFSFSLFALSSIFPHVLLVSINCWQLKGESSGAWQKPFSLSIAAQLNLVADVSSNITHDKRLPRIHFLQIQVKTPKYTILKHTFHFTTTLPLFFLRLLPHKDPEHNNKKTTLNSMSYEIWEIWSQEPCLVLD